MTTMTARKAKNEFGTFIDAAQKEPVIVTKHNRPVAALVSIDDLNALNKYRDAEAKTIPQSAGPDIGPYIGSLRGVWGNTPEEIDAYIRAERDSWE
jgi:prevent-host-death family protein